MIIDDGPIGCGETGRTTAHLSNAIDDRYTEIERLHGANGARLAAESHTAAIARIEHIISEERILCDFERLNGYLFLAPHDSSDLLHRELEAAHRAGLHEVVRLAQAPLPGPHAVPRLLFPNQGQFHPLKYLEGLAKAIHRKGGRIYTATRAKSVTGGSPVRIETHTGRTITANAVVVATNTPINNIVVIHTKQAAYRTYAIGIRVPCPSLEKGLYWDTQDPYHYAKRYCIHDRWDLLIVGGEDHKTGQAEHTGQPYSPLASCVQTRFSIDCSL